MGSSELLSWGEWCSRWPFSELWFWTRVLPSLILLINLFVETTCRTFDPSSPVVSLTSLILPTKPLAEVMSLRMARKCFNPARDIFGSGSRAWRRVVSISSRTSNFDAAMPIDAPSREKKPATTSSTGRTTSPDCFGCIRLSSGLSMVRSAEQHLAYALRPFSPFP